MASVTSVEAYLAALPDDRRAALSEIRRAVNAAAPEATETIAYQMPALRSHGGQFLVSYAAFKNHYSLFPASDAVIEALGDEVAPYVAGKGTLRFPADQPIPVDTVTKIVKIRLEELAAREARSGDRLTRSASGPVRRSSPRAARSATAPSDRRDRRIHRGVVGERQHAEDLDRPAARDREWQVASERGSAGLARQDVERRDRIAQVRATG